MKQVCLGVVIGAGLTLPAFAQQAVYPEEGVYVLNPAKSTFRGPGIKTQVLYVGKETTTVVGFDANGKPITAAFPFGHDSDDGQPHPTPSALPFFDAQTITRIDPYTTKTVRTKDGKVVSTLTGIYNPDGKTWTVTSIGTVPAAYGHVWVFEKQ